MVVCLASIDTGSIWAAFLIHSIMSQLNDYLAVRANPGMRYAFGAASAVNVLVTGATGYVGQRLAFRLAESGVTVHALCRSEEKATALAHEHIRIFSATLPTAPRSTAPPPGAGRPITPRRWSASGPRIPGTTPASMSAAPSTSSMPPSAAGVERVVITSTAGVFGPSEGGLVDEATPRRIPFFNEYESSKAAMHAAVRERVAAGADAVIVCPTRVYGPGPMVEGNAATRMIERYIAGRWRALPGDGNRSGNYVFIDDVVDGHLAAMDERPGRARPTSSAARTRPTGRSSPPLPTSRASATGSSRSRPRC